MSDHPINRTPVSATIKGKGFLERWGAAHVESNRWFIGFIFMTIVCLILTYTIISILPLKTVTPYIVNVKDTGKVEGTPIESIKFEPDENSKRYFLKEWITKVFTLDRFLTEKYLIEAYSVVRERGTEEFRLFIDQNKPLIALRSDPALVQNIVIRSVSFLQNQAALLRIRIETRSNAGFKQEGKLVTVHYLVIPPKTEQEIYANPLGLFITHFAVSEDVN